MVTAHSHHCWSHIFSFWTVMMSFYTVLVSSQVHSMWLTNHIALRHAQQSRFYLIPTTLQSQQCCFFASWTQWRIFTWFRSKFSQYEALMYVCIILCLILFSYGLQKEMTMAIMLWPPLPHASPQSLVHFQNQLHRLMVELLQVSFLTCHNLLIYQPDYTTGAW